VDSNFVTEFNEIAALGTSENPENISEINSKLEIMLDPAVKAF